MCIGDREPPITPRGDVEFLSRHRFPRPLAVRATWVLTEHRLEALRRAVQQCAQDTLRFLAAIHQAQRWARGEVDHAVVPAPRDLEQGFPEDYFVTELAGLRAPTERLLALAGEVGGPPTGTDPTEDRRQLLEGLASLAPLARYRLVVPGPWDPPHPPGAVVLLGAQLTFTGQVLEGRDIPSQEPALCDPHTGRLLSLAPLLHWDPGPTPPKGGLHLLRELTEGGIYCEVSGRAPLRLRRPLSGRPMQCTVNLPIGAPLDVLLPRVRFGDGDQSEPGYVIDGLMARGREVDTYRAVRLKDELPVVLKVYPGDPVGDPPGTAEIVELDYLPGGSLAERLAREGVLDPHDTLTLTETLCQQLQLLHEAGTTQLDLEPESLFFTRDGQVRILDPGHHLRPQTPQHIPPEQRAHEPLDQRTDLWHLGVLLSELFLGVPRQTPVAVPPPPRLPEVLGELLRRLLAPDPAGRYGSAREVIEALRSAVTQLRPLRCIALDLEGTLLTTAYDPLPRPFLLEFAEWCLETFDRVFIYTAVEETTARVIIARLTRAGVLPRDFSKQAKLVTWPRGGGGTLKDLRPLHLPLHWVVLLDDMRAWIVEDQRHRWVEIAAFHKSKQGDEELRNIRPEILARFTTDPH